MKFLTACVVAAVAGYLQSFLVNWGMANVALHLQYPAWLAQQGLDGSALIATAVAIDFPVVVGLWLPAAILLAQLRPRRAWVYLAVAVLPMFFWLNFVATGPREPAAFLFGLVPALVAPTTALLLVLWFKRHRQMPNNSFKPNPLRGSA